MNRWDLRITTSQLHNLAVEVADLLLDGVARFEQRHDCSHQIGTILDQLFGSYGQDIETGAADDKTEVLEKATDMVLKIDAAIEPMPDTEQRLTGPLLPLLNVPFQPSLRRAQMKRQARPRARRGRRLLPRCLTWGSSTRIH